MLSIHLHSHAQSDNLHTYILLHTCALCAVHLERNRIVVKVNVWILNVATLGTVLLL